MELPYRLVSSQHVPNMSNQHCSDKYWASVSRLMGDAEVLFLPLPACLMGKNQLLASFYLDSLRKMSYLRKRTSVSMWGTAMLRSKGIHSHSER